MISRKKLPVRMNFLQCFKSRDDNFSSNYFISKGQLQIHFPQLLFDPTFWNSYGGQPLISRNFCQKYVREIFRNFHNVAQCENYRKFFSRIFGKNFVKATVLLKKSLDSWFDGIFLQWEYCKFDTYFCTLCTVWNTRNLLSLKKYFVKSTI